LPHKYCKISILFN